MNYALSALAFCGIGFLIQGRDGALFGLCVYLILFAICFTYIVCTKSK